MATPPTMASSPSTDRRQDFDARLDSLGNLAAIRRNLAHTNNTSNAPALATLISKNSGALREIYSKGHHVTPGDFDRIVALMNDFGQGYDSSGGLEYHTFKDLDLVLVEEIRGWTGNMRIGATKPNLRTWSAIRAKMKASATSAAQALDELILLGLEMEVELLKTGCKRLASNKS